MCRLLRRCSPARHRKCDATRMRPCLVIAPTLLCSRRSLSLSAFELGRLHSSVTRVAEADPDALYVAKAIARWARAFVRMRSPAVCRVRWKVVSACSPEEERLRCDSCTDLSPAWDARAKSRDLPPNAGDCRRCQHGKSCAGRQASTRRGRSSSSPTARQRARSP